MTKNAPSLIAHIGRTEIDATSSAGGKKGTVLSDASLSRNSHVYNSAVSNSRVADTFADGATITDSTIAHARLVGTTLENTHVRGDWGKRIDIFNVHIVGGYIDDEHPLFFDPASTKRNLVTGIDVYAYWLDSSHASHALPSTFVISCDGFIFTGDDPVAAAREHFGGASYAKDAGLLKDVDEALGKIEGRFVRDARGGFRPAQPKRGEAAIADAPETTTEPAGRSLS